MIETSAKEMPMGYTSRSNSSSGSFGLACWATLGESGSARAEGNQSCIPRAPYVHHGISTLPRPVKPYLQYS